MVNNSLKRETLLHCWWDCKLVQPLWKSVWQFLRKLDIVLLEDPAIPLLGIYPEDAQPVRRTQWDDKFQACSSSAQGLAGWGGVMKSLSWFRNETGGPQRRLAGPDSSSTMSNFLRNRQTDFQSGCTSLQSHQQWRSVPLSPC